MSARYKNDWIRTVGEFYERTNFPNCIGAVNGKDIRMRQPNESGSHFLDYCFTSVEVGRAGIAQSV
jgi:hypothetical protein